MSWRSHPQQLLVSDIVECFFADGLLLFRREALVLYWGWFRNQSEVLVVHSSMSSLCRRSQLLEQKKNYNTFKDGTRGGKKTCKNKIVKIAINRHAGCLFSLQWLHPLRVSLPLQWTTVLFFCCYCQNKFDFIVQGALQTVALLLLWALIDSQV